MASKYPLLAVDIGNARIKLGWFRSWSEKELPEPERILPIDGDRPSFEGLATWLGEWAEQSVRWHIASVNRPSATRLVDWLRNDRPDDRITLLSAADLPLTISLERPDMVGIDRLVDAVAVNRLRRPGTPAVVVDVGSAITVDWISEEGTFEGGSILPGLAMSARALHEFTDLLPLIATTDLYEPPPALGTCTEEAMRSGLFWGAVGAIRQLVEELGRKTVEQPQIFLTGGAGVAVANLLGPRAQYVPHLTLAGIALSGGFDPISNP